MLKSYRELDTIIVEAIAATEQMLADFERSLLGRRAPQVFEEDEDGEGQRIPEAGDAGAEETEREGDEPEEPDDSAEDERKNNQVAYGAPGR